MTYIERLFWALYLSANWYEGVFLRLKNSDGQNMRRLAVYGRCRAVVMFDRLMLDRFMRDDKKVQGPA